MAALSAERSVARIRCNVDGDGSLPRLFGVVASVVNMAATCRPVRSPNRTEPTCGLRSLSMCPA
jgi:hypothetical protein